MLRGIDEMSIADRRTTRVTNPDSIPGRLNEPGWAYFRIEETRESTYVC
jgi:hypothetical protein